MADASDAWDKEFIEDATWNVMNQMVSNVGRAVGVNETTDILNLYAGVQAGDLASGAELQAAMQS